MRLTVWLMRLFTYSLTQMADMLHHGSGMAPGRPNVKVRDLGRDILQKANRCSWIEFMTDPQPPPDLITVPKKTKRITIRKEVADSVTSWKEAYKMEVKEEPEIEEAEKEKPKEEAVLNVITSNQTELAKSHLDILQKLQAQQQALIEQQKSLNNEIQRHMSSHITNTTASNNKALSDKEDFQGYTPTTSPTSSQEALNTCLETDASFTQQVPSLEQAPSEHRMKRRLKGDLAKCCAMRDQGSVGSLIFREWYVLPNSLHCVSLSHFFLLKLYLLG